jgi:serine/threonine protein kinase
MSSHHPHPTLAQLQAFEAGHLSAAERGPVEGHLEECPTCCATLDALPEAPLVAMMRAMSGRRPFSGLPCAGGENQGSAADFPKALMGHPRYRVLEVLGAGGMGVVYKAVHRLMDRVVALKVIHRHLTDRPGLTERFRREVRAAARLSHPNIVTAYDADQVGDTHFLVMEYVAGTSLDKEVERQGPLPIAQACDLARQAALGLQHAHERGMVHRDLKPQNLLLTPTGQVKILDFGLAHVLDEQGPGTPLPSGVVVGTPDYLAPEQARDSAHVDIRADLYSLGCTLYHLLVGHPPFPNGTPLQKLMAHQQCSPPAVTAARPDVPAALAALVNRLLAKDPSARPPAPAAVAADLARFVDPMPVPPAPARRRSARRVLILAAGILAAVGLVPLAAYLARPARAPTPPPTDREESRPAESPPAPNALSPADVEARHKHQVRDRAVDWFRANQRGRPDHPAIAYMATHIDRDLEKAEAFQVLLGPGLLKSAKPTLLVGRAGVLSVFELGPKLTRGFPIPGEVCRIQNYSSGDDLRRATPRVLLTGLVLDDTSNLFPGRPITGSVAYRILDRWPGECALRLTYYFGKRSRSVLVSYLQLPKADDGRLSFSFPPLGDPQNFVPGPDVVFVEFITQDSGQTVVESNAAVAAVRVP